MSVRWGQATTPAATCSDSLKNGTETDVDCGGSCQPCVVGKACQVAGDCSSSSCASSVCAAPTCTDGANTGASGYDAGAGYQCLSTQCSNGNVYAGGSGLIWAQ